MKDLVSSDTENNMSISYEFLEYFRDESLKFSMKFKSKAKEPLRGQNPKGTWKI